LPEDIGPEDIAQVFASTDAPPALVARKKRAIAVSASFLVKPILIPTDERAKFPGV